MSNDNNDNSIGNGPHRRGSVGNAVFSSLFQRSPSASAPGPGAAFPPTTNMSDAAQRRRLSVSTMGIHGASPTSSSAPYHFRRASTSTNSESIDECAVEEDETGSPASAKTPSAPFRRMSMGGPPRNLRNGSTPTDQNQFAWSEQLRNRAESSVSGPRPSFTFPNGFGNSPPRGNGMQPSDRANSVAEMPAPPAQSPAPKPKQPERRKPDAFQERILKGDFYMD